MRTDRTADILWRPWPDAFKKSALARFATENGFDSGNYEDLHRWSISQKGDFWEALWNFTGVIGERGLRNFVANPTHPMTGASFFPDARVNLAENLLRGTSQRIAIIEADESGFYAEHSMGELRDRVAKVAEGLRLAGVEKGDTVGGVLPNRVDGLVALLATLAIGAIWSSCSPDFGAPAILDRLGQIEPKVLFVIGIYRYAGKDHNIVDRIETIARGLPSLRLVVNCGKEAVLSLPTEVRSTTLTEFGRLAPLSFERSAFDHPVYVLYTSGTTGAPKAIVHGGGAFCFNT